MTRVLFLTQRMMMGYGVDLAVHEVSQHLASRGVEVIVACNDADATYRGLYEIIELERGTSSEVRALANELAPAAIVACASPFIEMLPYLQQHYPSWAWEYGEPTPELFGQDSEERNIIRKNKIESCYPAIQGVLAISEFIRSDIEWSDAEVGYLGCDHVPDWGSKGLQDLELSRERPLRIGTLMRLGHGEARYKGNHLFCRLAEILNGSGQRFELSVMGRGDKASAEMFHRLGCRVSLNATDRGKWEYLRNLDAFVSCSLWEGFNLPLVEAQAIGTMAMAFDTGAHPEVCPLIFPNLEEMARFVTEAASDRSLLLRHSRAAYHHVRRRFLWEDTAARFREVVLGTTPGPKRELLASPHSPQRAPATRTRFARPLWATWRSLQLYGVGVTARKIRRRIVEALRTRRAD